MCMWKVWITGGDPSGVPLRHLTRHLVGLFQGCRGARAWRRCLSENVHRPGAGLDVVQRAAALVTEPA